jgi:hypothetical protein
MEMRGVNAASSVSESVVTECLIIPVNRINFVSLKRNAVFNAVAPLTVTVMMDSSVMV